MIQYPLSFFATANSVSGIQTLWDVQSSGHSLRCSIPTEFEGPGGALSPEDLFAQALTNCFLATFKVYVEKSKLGFTEMSAQTELIVDLDEKKRPIMNEAKIKVVIRGATAPERLRMLADKALASGFILNSVKTRVHLDLSFSS
jgi:organic hydroperoxide reductase OsmC/OhrA